MVRDAESSMSEATGRKRWLRELKWFFLLDIIVAIYLIFVGLVGMGLLKWLHM